MYYFTTYPSPVGLLTLSCDGAALTGLWLDGQKYFGSPLPQEAAERDDLPVFHAAKAWLDQYFQGNQPNISELALRPMGSEFRQTVWQILREIPYGEVTTYGEIAHKAASRLGRESMSGQAVGGAVGHNPISIIVPCHRVVGAGGSLTGYAGGIARKIKLLELEGVDLSRFTVPAKGTAL